MRPRLKDSSIAGERSALRTSLHLVSPSGRLSLLPGRLDLPRGRGALTEHEVAISQRGRILQAVTDEVAASGYHGTSIATIIKRARVSRSTFYAGFDNKEDAFAAAHAEASRLMFRRIAQRGAGVPDHRWRDRLERGVEAYLDGLESAPTFAVAFMVELRAAGTRLLDQRDHVTDLHARNLQAVAQRAVDAGERIRVPDDHEALAAMGATDELATRAIRSHGAVPGLSLQSLFAPIIRVQSAALDPSCGVC